MKTYKVRAYDIDYCVEDEDVCQEFDNDTELEEDSEEYYDAINERIEQIKSELPQDMVFRLVNSIDNHNMLWYNTQC